MNIIMVGLHYASSPLHIRERFTLSPTQTKKLAAAIKQKEGVEGCVILSTCNRSEIYLVLQPEASFQLIPFLCDSLGLPSGDYLHYFTRYENQQVVTHLFKVTSGLDSQLRGDDQILTQVHTAATLAREAEASCSTLETLFRQAVTSGKKIKTKVPLYSVERSVAALAVETVNKTVGEIKGKKALVIGNGGMGRLAASLLVASGWQVTVTLRHYKKCDTLVPFGCSALPYKDRYSYLTQCELLVSATTSPHFTVRKDELVKGQPLPPYMLDLAVPRDIDGELEKVQGVTCWNVDTLVPESQQVDPEKIKAIEEIIAKYEQDFYKWISYREIKATSRRAIL